MQRRQNFGWVSHNAFGPANNISLYVRKFSGELVKLVSPDVRL